jgi:hypothetical protein
VEASLDTSVCQAGEPGLQFEFERFLKDCICSILMDQEVYHPNHKYSVSVHCRLKTQVAGHNRLSLILAVVNSRMSRNDNLLGEPNGVFHIGTFDNEIR